MSKKLLLAVSSAALLLNVSPAFAADDADLQALRAEITAMKQVYESKIEQLESKVQSLETRQNQTAKRVASVEPAAGNSVPATSRRKINDNSFNPEIGVILQGKYQNFSQDSSEFAGFAVGEEAERGKEGLGIDETELNFSASVDDKFRGSATIALHEHGGSTEVEIEEAYVETISLPHGLQVKAGWFFSELGYLNSHHSHGDDFADRPLPNRAFLDGNYGDDGVQISAVLPTDIYSEIGGGVYRGDDFPGGGAEPAGTSNRKNGATRKTVKSSSGSFELDTPRDRAGSFEPQIVKKHQTHLTDEIEGKILSMFGLGMS